jgi:amino acid adenylation domain-containing protein
MTEATDGRGEAHSFHYSGNFEEFPKEDIETSIPRRFEKIAARYPEKLAVKIGDQSLTYDELNNAANCLARVIYDERGNKREPIVLFTEQSIQAIIACLGIFKAGKILVLIDAGFPLERISSMIAQCNAAGILAQNSGIPVAQSLAKPTQLVKDIEAIDYRFRQGNLGLEISPDDPAQIRFTSGSTGVPKGVTRSHRRILHGNSVTINGGRIAPDDRLLVVRHLSFTPKDAFNGLLVGSAIYPYDIRNRGMSELADVIMQNALTYMTATPSIFRYFVSELRGDYHFPSVRVIQLGGEPLFKSEVELFKKFFGSHCTLMNQLSMNEAGTLCQQLITRETEIDTAIVPVGYPVEGKTVFVVDEERKDIGSSGVGEIAVKSHYLSSGYWGDQGLTAAKYSSDPNSAEERIYYTGDLGQVLSDGRLVYLGRKDDQVKIRGGKVNGSEVQAHLLSHPEIKNAAVIASEQEAGETTLVAYIVPHRESTPAVEKLIDFLKQKLPSYMIPSAFIFMESLPLTNGKLNRRALPKPDRKRPDLNTPYVAPVRDFELKVAKIWEAVLEVRPVGIHDNFFDLGGHSLAATRVVSRVMEQFQLEIPLQALFQSPTVAEMASVIVEHRYRKLGKNELENILNELEALSDEEAKRLVSKDSSKDHQN